MVYFYSWCAPRICEFANYEPAKIEGKMHLRCSDDWKNEFSQICVGKIEILLILSDSYGGLINNNFQNTIQELLSEWAYACPFANSYSGNGYHSILTKYFIDGLGYLSSEIKCFED